MFGGQSSTDFLCSYTSVQNLAPVHPLNVPDHLKAPPEKNTMEIHLSFRATLSDQRPQLYLFLTSRLSLPMEQEHNHVIWESAQLCWW